MLVRVKNTYRQAVSDALAYHKHLPRCKITGMREYNGEVLDVDPGDAEELMGELENLGFECYPDENLP